MSTEAAPLLQAVDITKAYPGTIANNAVNFTLYPGEIHALLGENGAGKSTLVKILYGLVKADAGQMLLDGAPYTPNKPSDARKSGLAMVFQHFTLFEAMTVAENIAIGMEEPQDVSRLEDRITALSENYGLPVQPNALVANLSTGERQRVEIVRCLLQNPRLLIMDEPTSVLTPQEVDTLFTTLRKLSEEGTAILYISHKLSEIKALCSRATVLRGGEVVAHCDPQDETPQSMATMMVGTALSVPEKKTASTGKTVLSATNISLSNGTTFGSTLQAINFELAAGSIYGIGGIAGNGQDELLAVLSGETLSPKGSLLYKNTDISRLSPNARRKMGIVSSPEERLGHSAAPTMSLVDNAVLSARVRRGLTSWGFIKRKQAKAYTESVIQQFDVRTSGPNAEAKSLSGGNLQKFIIGREVLQEPEVIIINQPTWGVDAAAAMDIRNALRKLASNGVAVVVISQDLDELLELADQFSVLVEGSLSEAVPTSDLSLDAIGLMMGGSLGGQAAEDQTKSQSENHHAAT